jgi:hypothetical protein
VKPEHHEIHAPAESGSIDRQLIELRSRISDLGYEVDLYKAGIASSMGGGLFLLLLAAGAGYDLITGKAGIWSPLGVTNDLLLFIAWGLGAVGAALLIRGIARQRHRDRERDAQLAELERQYARLLDRKEMISQK